MNIPDKILYILSIIALVIGVLSIRVQSPVILLSILFTLSIAFLHPYIGLSTTIIQLLLLYPGSNIGYLYGRDSVSLSSIAVEISRHGWPIDQVLFLWGDPSTPLLHFVIVMGSRVTGLNILPRTSGELIFSTFVPILAVGGTLLLIAILTRHFDSTSMIPYAMLPALLWVPFFKFYTGVRRGSLSIFFLLLLIYLINRYESERRMLIVLSPLLLAIPAAHTVGAFVSSLLFLSTIMIVGYTRIVSLLFTSALTLWYLWITFRFELFASLSLLYVREYSFNISSVSNTEVALLEYISWLSTHLTILIFALIFVTVIILRLRKKDVSLFDIEMFLFSICIGIITIIMYFSSGGLSHIRASTYFIVGVCWLPIIRIKQILNNNLTWNTFITIICVFLILSASINIEPHIISDSEPDYKGGETDQRFRTSTYAAGYWVKGYATKEVIGDANTMEVVMPISQKSGHMAGSEFVNGTIKPNNLLLFAGRNNDNFVSYHNDTWYRLRTKSTLQREFNSNSSRIYNNGWISGYQNLNISQR